MITKRVTIRFIDCHQFDNGSGKKVTIFYCKASEILKQKKENVFPLAPNVRNPKAGKITNNILKSLKENANYCIESPIVLIVKTVAILSENRIFIEFSEVDGILDGGHRMLALDFLKFHGINPDDVTLCFKVMQGLSKPEIIKLGESLNTSVAPTRQSLLNYRGEYDWIKNAFKGFDFDISYYENQNLNRNDNLCQISRIICFIVILDLEYNLSVKYSIKDKDLRRKYAHPVNYSSQQYLLTKDGLKASEDNMTRMFFGILMQTRIALLIEKIHKSNPLPKVTIPKSKKALTYLPTGETLSVKIPANLYVYPIISSYRCVFEDIENCLYVRLVENDYDGAMSMLKALDKVTEKQIFRIKKLLSQVKNTGRTNESILQDESIWQEMHIICEDNALMIKQAFEY